MRIQLVGFDTHYAEICRIRFAVFVDEQDVPSEMEIDDRDPHCLHVLAFDGEEVIGTGRIDIGQAGKVGRVAAIASRRRQGVGTALMRRLHDLSTENGLRGVWCHAQTSAVPFYERLGYRVTGAPFREAGIEHVKMRCSL